MTIEFIDWWCKNGNMNKAEQLYSKKASAICNRVDPDIKIVNLYTDILEKLAFKHKLHLM